VNLTREGVLLFYSLLAAAGLLFVVALVRRSWSTWLLALTCTVLALGAAYLHRADAVVARAAGVMQ
jgi:hypothetical protein